MSPNSKIYRETCNVMQIRSSARIRPQWMAYDTWQTFTYRSRRNFIRLTPREEITWKEDNPSTRLLSAPSNRALCLDEWLTFTRCTWGEPLFLPPSNSAVFLPPNSEHATPVSVSAKWSSFFVSRKKKKKEKTKN